MKDNTPAVEVRQTSSGRMLQFLRGGKVEAVYPAEGEGKLSSPLRAIAAHLGIDPPGSGA